MMNDETNNNRRIQNYSSILLNQNQNTDERAIANDLLKYQDMRNKIFQSELRKALSNPKNISNVKI